MRCYGEAAFFFGLKRSLYYSTWRSFHYRSAPEFGAQSVWALYGWSTSFWGISKRAFFSGHFSVGLASRRECPSSSRALRCKLQMTSFGTPFHSKRISFHPCSCVYLFMSGEFFSPGSDLRFDA